MDGFGTLDRLVMLILPITLILAVAGVIVVRPLSKALGELLIRQRADTDRLEDLESRLESLSDSISQVEGQLRKLGRGTDGPSMPTPASERDSQST